MCNPYHSDLCRQLRTLTRFEGRCGPCELADLCGGSRARAYATTGDYLAEDPACNYQPAAAREAVAGV